MFISSQLQLATKLHPVTIRKVSKKDGLLSPDSNQGHASNLKDFVDCYLLDDYATWAYTSITLSIFHWHDFLFSTMWCWNFERTWAFIVNWANTSSNVFVFFFFFFLNRGVPNVWSIISLIPGILFLFAALGESF